MTSRQAATRCRREFATQVLDMVSSNLVEKHFLGILWKRWLFQVAPEERVQFTTGFCLITEVMNQGVKRWPRRCVRRSRWRLRSMLMFQSVSLFLTTPVMMSRERFLTLSAMMKLIRSATKCQIRWSFSETQQSQFLFQVILEVPLETCSDVPHEVCEDVTKQVPSTTCSDYKHWWSQGMLSMIAGRKSSKKIKSFSIGLVWTLLSPDYKSSREDLEQYCCAGETIWIYIFRDLSSHNSLLSSSIFLSLQLQNTKYCKNTALPGFSPFLIKL